MNKRQKEVQQAYLNNEKAVLKQIERNYQDALDEINSKIELLMARQDADMQHVIYQVEYQKALRTQVQAILEQLQTNEFETVSEYIAQSYEEGFLGTMYDLQGQGIPLVFPIDQEQVVDAIQHETNLSESLYTAMGHDIKDLQKKISGEISRGLATGQMFSEISRNIASWARIPKNNAMRIARTEGHRIQCKASMDACNKAKSKGADVVKQWDASLDKRTRDSHAQIDGEIKELDEKFSNGLMYPGDPSGSAGEVINCRCALLQRARWALGNDYTKWSPDAPVVISDDGTTQLTVIETKNYKDFQKQYKQASERVRSNVQKMNDGFVPAKTIKEAEEYAQRFVSDLKTKYSGNVSYKSMDIEYANKLNKVLTNTFAKYNCGKLGNIQPINFREKRFKNTTASASYEWGEGTLRYNGRYFANAKALAEHEKEANDLLQKVLDGANVLLNKPNLNEFQKAHIMTLLKTGRECVAQSYDFVEATFTHEVGHMLDEKLFKLQLVQNRDFLKKSMEKYAGNISGYAMQSSTEYIAESYTAYCFGETDILDPELVKIFKGAEK
ncbi:MAG: hypothetical protein IJZ23_06925 [Roseburia sp.]|nr:hypothetical protein [Roseburia sp.]MBQ8279558.1 hypothetical protein [Roseburia sp.]